MALVRVEEIVYLLWNACKAKHDVPSLNNRMVCTFQHIRGRAFFKDQSPPVTF